MKRILAFVLALLITLPAASIAEEFSWDQFADSLPVESLGTLVSFLRMKYISRVCEAFDVPAGEYIVGVDFPEGSWSFEMVSNGTEICVYKDAVVYGGDFPIPTFDQILNETLGVTKIGNLYLASGNILVVEGHVTAKPFTGLGF